MLLIDFLQNTAYHKATMEIAKSKAGMRKLVVKLRTEKTIGRLKIRCLYFSEMGQFNVPKTFLRAII